MESTRSQQVEFTEVLRPPTWLLSFLFFLLGSLAISIWAAFNDATGAIALLIGVAITIAANHSLALRIEVTNEELRVGDAHIERKYLGAATAMNIEEMRLTRGRNADPAAFLALRFWQPRGVKIEVVDSRDPTPYWLITSKNSTTLSDVLNQTQSKEG